MPVNLWRANMGIDPTPGIKRFRFVVMVLFRVILMVVMGMVMLMVVVQVVTVHVHATVEVTIRLPHHRPRNILLGISQQHGQNISTRNRLWHLRGGRLATAPTQAPKALQVLRMESVVSS